VDNGNLEFRLLLFPPLLISFSSANVPPPPPPPPFLSPFAGGIGLDVLWVTITWGCGRTMANLGVADVGRLERQLEEEDGMGGRRLDKAFADDWESMAMAATVFDEKEGMRPAAEGEC
jgi:hypothetical protein